MKRFIARYADKIMGVLSGFDRLVFRGTVRQIAYCFGMMGFLWKNQVRLKEFGQYALAVTEQLKEASLGAARTLGRPVEYVASSRTNKEAIARRILQRDKIQEGLIAVVTCLEPCRTYDLHRNREAKRLDLVSRIRKCLVLYHYGIDPVFGFMNARIQTWFPFSIQICINGREWLAQAMDRAGISYQRRDNGFPWIQDLPRAQKLMDQQLQIAWPEALGRIARQLNPAHPQMFQKYPLDYYWSVYQSEWATDVMFKDIRSLSRIYPALIHHGMTTFSSPDVLRFLGQVPHGHLQKEVLTSFKDRAEGVRIKHWVGDNSLKAYDKGSLLRMEATLQDPYGFKVFRPKEGNSDGPRAWRPMRRGIADLYRRAQVSNSINDRYLDALARVDTSMPMGDLVRDLCRPTTYGGKPVRALMPWTDEDVKLLKAIHRGEFKIHGLRNRDLQNLLYDRPADSVQEKRRRSAHVTRLFRMLRAHGLIRKVPSSHRYHVSSKGNDLIPPLLAIQHVSLEQLQRAVA